jgi:DNA (cytosine-5)-methyltransferase 1
MSERRPTVLSLFSGVGGFDMGLERAGFETVYQCEIDKHARSVLDRHWPDVPKWGDITTLTADEILRHTSHIDVVAWGSPCQDLSVAGKRAGLDGDRSSLFHEGVRLITELRKATNNEYPRFSIWENVAGALSSNSGRDFHTVIDQMAEAGAHLQEYALLDSQYFGIPQRRRRVFLLSVFHSDIADRCADPILPVSESMRRDSAKGKSQGQATTRETAESTGIDSDWDIEQPIVGSLQAHLSQGASADDAAHGLLIPTHSSQVYTKAKRASSVDDDETWVAGAVHPTLNAFDIGDVRTVAAVVSEPILSFDTQFGSNANVFTDQSPTLKASQQSPSVLIQNVTTSDAVSDDPIFFQAHQSGETRVQSDVMHTLAGYMGTGGNNTPMVAYSIREDAKANNFSATEITSARALQAHQPSVQSHHAQTFIASDAVVRRLLPIECERLMGWGDDHTRWKADGTEQADSHRYKQCGNGVASPVATWIGEQIRVYL